MLRANILSLRLFLLPVSGNRLTFQNRYIYLLVPFGGARVLFFTVRAGVLCCPPEFSLEVIGYGCVSVFVV